MLISPNGGRRAPRAQGLEGRVPSEGSHRSSFPRDLLTHYTGKPLIDPYDIYQHLMDYWARDHAGRLLSHRRRRLEGRDLSRHRDGQEGQGEGQRLDLRPRSPSLSSSPATIAKEQAAIESAQPPSWKASLPNSPNWKKNTAARKARSPNSTR